MRVRVSYRICLIAAMGFLALGTGMLIAGQTFYASRRTVKDLTDRLFQRIAAEIVERTRSHLGRAVPAIELLRSMHARSGPPPREPLLDELTDVLAANSGFSWVSYSDMSGEFNGVYRTADRHVRRNHSDIVGEKTILDEFERDDSGNWQNIHHEADSGYDPRKSAFFSLAERAGRRVWTQPYVYYRNTVVGVTCTAPLYVAGALRGVFTVDFDLNRLSEFVSAIRVSEHGRVFLFTPDGKLLAHPTERMIETWGTGNEGHILTVAASHDPLVRAVAAHVDGARLSQREMLQEIHFRDGDDPYLALVASFAIDELEPGGARPNDAASYWLVGVVAPESDFLGSVQRTNLTALSISVIALGGALLLALFLASRVSRPLRRLAREMERVGSFDLDDGDGIATIFREVATMSEALTKMKRSLRSFANYVPRDLVRSLIASGHEAKLGGELSRLTVFFSDLAGYTGLSEVMTPTGLVTQLGVYLDEMTRTIGAEGGTVDKFIGDGIMAFWGAPHADDEHAARACIAALRSQQQLEELRSRPEGAWLRGMDTRIGLATGDVVVGNIGTPDRMNYTVMGDTVNLAARLESLSKQYKTLLLADEATVTEAKGAVVARPIEVVAVRGRQNRVRVYELLAIAKEASKETLCIARATAAGHAAYVAEDFVAAEKSYLEVLALRPDDRVAAIFLERSREYQKSPPPSGWGGVYVAREK